MNLQRWMLGVLVLALMPTAADAQRRRAGERFEDRYWNRFSLEPYAGAFKDAFDASGSDTGYLVGMRVGYELGSRGRLQLNAGYSEVDNVATPVTAQDYFVFDNNWIFTTLGGEFDVIPGRTSASLGAHAGAAWRKTTVDERIGNPPGIAIDDEGYSALEVLVPGLFLRHRFTSRAAIALSLEDYIFDLFEGPVDHSPAVSLGFSFR